MDDDIWDATTFSKNRERLLKGDIAEEFFERVVERARGYGLLSDEHFTVDGTLIEAAAGLKSFKKKGDGDKTLPDDPGNPTVNFHGEKRSNQTHQSTTDSEALLSKKGKGKEPKLNLCRASAYGESKWAGEGCQGYASDWDGRAGYRC